jgi:hypothetical protein
MKIGRFFRSSICDFGCACVDPGTPLKTGTPLAASCLNLRIGGPTSIISLKMQRARTFCSGIYAPRRRDGLEKGEVADEPSASAWNVGLETRRGLLAVSLFVQLFVVPVQNRGIINECHFPPICEGFKNARLLFQPRFLLGRLRLLVMKQ